jgi:serine/threonine protein kinase
VFLQCDIWACGVLAYELLVGKPPFEVKDEMETRKRIMYETTLTLPPHVSPEAVNFIKVGTTGRYRPQKALIECGVCSEYSSAADQVQGLLVISTRLPLTRCHAMHAADCVGQECGHAASSG